MKVKIVRVIGHRLDDYSNYYEPQETSDWDEVSEDELKILKSWVLEKNNKYPHDELYCLLLEAQVDIPKTIKQYMERAKKELEDKAAKEKIQKEAIEKRTKTMLKKKEKKEKQLLEELKKKYGD